MSALAASRSSTPSVRNISRSPGSSGSVWTWKRRVRASRRTAGRRRAAPRRRRRRAAAAAAGGPALTIVAVPVVEVDADDLAGDELRAAGVLAERLVGEARLLRQVRVLPAAVADAADHQRGEQRRVDRVAHRVGDREEQLVAPEREVERVAADLAGGLQPRRERELPGLARVRAGQQPVLDLGGERERHRALAPLEQVGVPAVGDDDVRERVAGLRDRRRSSASSGGAGSAELEHADRLAAAGDRRVEPRAVVVLDDLDALARAAPARAACRRARRARRSRARRGAWRRRRRSGRAGSASRR